MNPKQRDISTVIIVNKGNQRTKTIQIATRHLGRLKHYAFGIFGVIALLTLAVVYFAKAKKTEEAENKALLSQLSQLKSSIPEAINTQQTEAKRASDAQAYVQNIETKLQKINDYLKKRGLKGFSTQAVGGNGNAEAAKLTDEETYSLYDEYLDRLLHTVAFTPMGYPRMSSLTSFFGYRSDPFESGTAEFHPGIDFKGQKGDDARCTANGKVVYAGWLGGYGNCVRIAHMNNLETLYGHLSHIDVKVGQEVTAGQKIGEVGSTGRSTGAHLHYEVRKNGKAINPVGFLSLNN